MNDRDPLKTPCRCQHTALRHDTFGGCELCPCLDFVPDDVAIAAAVGVLVPEQRNGGQ